MAPASPRTMNTRLRLPSPTSLIDQPPGAPPSSFAIVGSCARYSRRSASGRIRYCCRKPSGGCSCKLIGSLRFSALLPLQEIRADIGLLPDRIVIAIDAVGDQGVARDDGVLVWLDRVQSDHRGLLAA